MGYKTEIKGISRYGGSVLRIKAKSCNLETSDYIAEIEPITNNFRTTMFSVVFPDGAKVGDIVYLSFTEDNPVLTSYDKVDVKNHQDELITIHREKLFKMSMILNNNPSKNDIEHISKELYKFSKRD